MTLISIPFASVKPFRFVLIFTLGLNGCEADTALPSSEPLAGSTMMMPALDQTPSSMGGQNGSDMMITALDQSLPNPMPDMMVQPMAGVMAGDEAGIMAGVQPILGGTPMDLSCDPRLRAQSCEAGSTCQPIPGGEVYQGQCVLGDGCDPVLQTGCPPEAPLCHLDGRATRCVQALEPPLGEGSSCLTEDNRTLPCGEGLVCNFSFCAPVCDPSVAENACLDGRPCLDLTERVGQAVGYCGFLGLCDPFTGTGCAAQESCHFATRPDDLQISTFCVAEGFAQVGEICLENGVGSEGCASGLICIPSGNGTATCRQICDTGSYLAACPSNQSCREILSRGPNLPIRGIGLCVVNR